MSALHEGLQGGDEAAQAAIAELTGLRKGGQLGQQHVGGEEVLRHIQGVLLFALGEGVLFVALGEHVFFFAHSCSLFWGSCR